MYTIILNKEDLENLKVFLARTNLSGKEVAAFNKIINTISNAKELEKEIE